MLQFIIIFIIVIFVYSHVMREYKMSDDLEIFELTYTTNAELQTVCNLKQPTVFSLQNTAPNFANKISSRIATTNCSAKLNVFDVLDYEIVPHKSAEPILLSLPEFEKLCVTDPNAHFITENNEDFLDDSGIYAEYEKMDDLLKDYFVIKKYYDVLMGSQNACFPLRYHKNSRQFFIVASGKIRVKMTPYKYAELLHDYRDLTTFEFGSPINVWNPAEYYKADLDKIQFLEFDVEAGSVLYLPPYWFSSIQLVEEKTVVSSITYYSASNVMANSLDIFEYWRQRGGGGEAAIPAIPARDTEPEYAADNSVDDENDTQPEENK